MLFIAAFDFARQLYGQQAFKLMRVNPSFQYAVLKPILGSTQYSTPLRKQYSVLSVARKYFFDKLYGVFRLESRLNPIFLARSTRKTQYSFQCFKYIAKHLKTLTKHSHTCTCNKYVPHFLFNFILFFLQKPHEIVFSTRSHIYGVFSTRLKIREFSVLRGGVHPQLWITCQLNPLISNKGSFTNH